MKVLWQWSKTKDEWLWTAAVPDDACQKTLRGYKRRNTRGTVFRWREDGEGPPIRKYRQRTVKEKA